MAHDIDAPLLLMTPGPTRVPDRVLRAGAHPMIHHRTPAFSAELVSMVRDLAPLFGTTQPVLPIHTTGRGALEAAICNLFSPGDEIAVCCNGRFGEMWASFAESYGVVVHRIATDWERDISTGDVDHVMDAHPSIKAIAIAYCDTSTGVENDVASIARVAAARGVLMMVDAVSSLGGMPFAMDEWGVDVAVSASQKCLMSSPGLAFAVLSDRAWAMAKEASLPRNYWDFDAVRQELAKPRPETPGTAPVHLVFQVAEALRIVHEEGLASFQERHNRMAALARTGIAELGLSLQAPGLARQARTVTAIALPSTVAPQPLRDALVANGILTAAAMGPYRTSGFRIGHMGDIREADVRRTLDALAAALSGAAHATASLA